MILTQMFFGFDYLLIVPVQHASNHQKVFIYIRIVNEPHKRYPQFDANKIYLDLPMQFLLFQKRELKKNYRFDKAR